MIRHWISLHREVIESPSVEVFKRPMDTVFKDLIQQSSWLCQANSWVDDLRANFQCNLFYDSMHVCVSQWEIRNISDPTQRLNFIFYAPEILQVLQPQYLCGKICDISIYNSLLKVIYFRHQKAIEETDRKSRTALFRIIFYFYCITVFCQSKYTQSSFIREKPLFFILCFLSSRSFYTGYI